MSNEKLLRETLFFRNLELSELKSIFKISSEKKYKPGDILCKENDEADSILIIKSGLVRIAKGAEEVEISDIGPGDALGELSFLDSGSRSATATAVEPTVVIYIPYKKLNDLLEKNLKLAKDFYKSASEYVTHRIRKTTGDLQFSKEFVAKYVKYF